MVIIATSKPNKWKIGSYLIMVYQKTNFSHVLIVKEGVVYEASHGDTHSIPFELWKINNEVVNLYLIPDSKVDLDYVEAMVTEDISYGFMQIIRIAIKYFFGLTINKNNGNARLICSEYIGRALRLDWVNDYTSPKEIDDYLKNLRLTDE